jgi:hypothetical protein
MSRFIDLDRRWTLGSAATGSKEKITVALKHFLEGHLVHNPSNQIPFILLQAFNTLISALEVIYDDNTQLQLVKNIGTS